MGVWKRFKAWLSEGRGHMDKRDWSILLLSLFLSFSVWFIYNLGKTYTAEVAMPVRLSSSLEGHSLQSSNIEEISAQCKPNGFTLSRINRYVKNHVRVVEVDPSMLHSKSAELFYLTEKDLLELAPQIFGDNANVDNLLTDTAFFRFPEEKFKKVPVEFMGDLRCKDQYTISGGLTIEPDSVLVYGESGVLENINSVRTEMVVRTDLDKELRGNVKLRPITDARLSVSQVRYRARVTRYVELAQSYTLKVRNVPKGKDVLVLPSEVNVVFTCPFPLESDPRDAASFYVDYAEFESSYNGKCQVRIEREIPGVLRWSASQEMVQCIVNE